ncbi:MAG TPA: DUF2383 domain-containing protein [Stellaceae bacterium]|nr:DUF2383 domain-containing protein [Stellaceae bacterium]
MGTVQNHDIDVLNGLISASLDSAIGFETAARGASDADRQVLEQRAVERRRIRMVLQDMVRSLGVEPVDRGSLRSAAARAILRVKSDIAGIDGIGQHLDAAEERLHAELMAAAEDATLSVRTRNAIHTALRLTETGHVGPPPLGGGSMAVH